jgi:hypothetical protein
VPVPVLAAGTGKTWAALGLPARRTLVRRRRRIVPTRLSDPAPEDRTRVKTGENSMPTNGEDSPAAHVHYFCVRPVLNTRNGVSGNPSSRDCERPARMVRPAEWNCARPGVRVGSTRLNAEHDNLIASPDTSCSATSRRLVAGGRTARSASGRSRRPFRNLPLAAACAAAISPPPG